MGKSVEHEIAKDHKDYEKLTHINGFNVYRGLLHNRYGPADLNCRTGQENYLYGECIIYICNIQNYFSTFVIMKISPSTESTVL